MRTALSRLVARGELTLADGWYEIGEVHAVRRRRQLRGREQAPGDWDGTWTVLVLGQAPDRQERDERRRRLVGADWGELREGVWTRPGDVEGPDGVDGEVLRGSRVEDPVALARRLWPLDEMDAEAGVVARELDEAVATLATGRPGGTRRAFEVAARCLRLFARDPRLPTELHHGELDELRGRYTELDVALSARLREVLAGVRPPDT